MSAQLRDRRCSSNSKLVQALCKWLANQSLKPFKTWSLWRSLLSLLSSIGLWWGTWWRSTLMRKCSRGWRLCRFLSTLPHSAKVLTSFMVCKGPQALSNRATTLWRTIGSRPTRRPGNSQLKICGNFWLRFLNMRERLVGCTSGMFRQAIWSLSANTWSWSISLRTYVLSLKQVGTSWWL